MTTFTPKDTWENKRRAHYKAPIPFGYTPSDDDPCVLVPDWDQIQHMEKALDYIDGEMSYRQAAAWLSTVMTRAPSHQAVKNWWEEKRGSDPNNARAIRLQTAERKQEKKREKLSPREKAERAQKIKVAAAKRALTFREKKLAGYQEVREPEPKIPTSPLRLMIEEPADESLEDKEIIFKPNPGPQTTFLAASEQEVLYGGAAGGGKSYALLADPARYFGHKNFNGLILRRTNDELRELKWKSRELYPRLYPGATWREKDSMWLFPSGAQLWMTYLERDEDVMRYQGQAFSYIAVDELTQYPTPFAWNYLRSRLRSADNIEFDGLPTFMRATTNPGGPGHGWVKRMFIDPAPAGQPFDATDIETGKVMIVPVGDPLFDEDRWGKPLFKRRFIPALLKDNPYLMKGGNYAANLLSLSENQRRQLLEGDWTVADGAAFPEFRANTHTCPPFEIPKEWRRFRSCDFGYNSFSAVHWYAIDPVYETLVVYRELYVTRHTGKELSEKILELEQGERIDYGVLDSSVWHVRGHNGPTIEEEMRMAGTRWRQSDRTAGARVAGKNRLHELLKVDETTGRPGIVFFNTCRQIITDLPIIPSDPDGTDDIDDRYTSDHAYDSVRYGIMSRPKSYSPFGFGMDTYAGGYRPADSKLGY
jgi:hypothetical protein